MKILSLGADPHLFTEGSRSQIKIKGLSEIFECFTVISGTRNKSDSQQKLTPSCIVLPAYGKSKISELYSMYKITNNELKAKNYDHITVQDPFLIGLVGIILSRIHSIPLQAQIHTDFASPYYKKSHWFNFIYVLIASYVLPKANSIRVVSERVTSFPKWFKKTVKPKVLPAWFDAQLFSREVKTLNLKQKHQAKKLVLVTGRLEKEKNLHKIFKAFFKACDEEPAVKLIVLGSGSLQEKLDKLVKEARMTDRVVFIPWVADVRPYYQECDLLVTFSNYEGFGLTIAEATAKALPVITSEVGLVNSLLSKEELTVCPVGDSTCLENSLSQWIINQEQFIKKGLLAQKTLLAFWPTHTEYKHKFLNTFYT